MSFTRRSILASISLTTVSLAGCTTINDALRSPPDRRVAPDWRPTTGTWPAANYDPTNTRYNPHATPPRTEPTQVWQQDVGDDVRALIVGEDRVFVATANELYAFDAVDGARRWRRAVEDTYRLQFIDGRVYELGSQVVRARAPSGETLWETTTPSWPYSLHEQSGYVLVGRQDGYSTLHADTGEIVRNRGAWVETMAVRHDTVYGKAPHSVSRYALQKRTLDEQWNASLSGPYHSYGSPILADDTLYQPERAMAGSDVPAGRISKYALDGTKTDATTFEHVPLGLAVADGMTFIGTSTITAGDLGDDGRVVALNNDGNRRWKYDSRAGVVAPIIIGDTVVVGPFARSDAPLIAFDVETGEQLWRRDVTGTARLAGAGRTVYVGEGTRVTALQG